MTPQKSMQRKPSLGSILEDLQEHQINWSTVAGDVELQGSATDVSAKIEEEARRREDEERRLQQEAEEDAAAQRIQAMHRGNRERRRVNELRARRATSSWRRGQRARRC